MKETFDYDDINLVPRLGILKSRSECDTTVKLGKHTFNLPIIPANMSSVINEEIAIKLAENNFFYIMHRFDINTIEFVEKMHNRNLIISISVGVTDYWYDIITKLKDIKITPDYITVDIAHGHSELAKNMILHIKNNLPNAFIIAGNVATKEGGLYLQSSGADAVKIGVGPGCFAAGTRILMSNGIYKNIEDIVAGEYIINKDGESKMVKKSFSTGYRDVIKYRTNTGVGFTTCTPDHKHFIGDLSTNNCIESTGYAKVLDKMAKTKPKTSKYKWKEIEQCNKENSVLLLPKNIKFNFEKEFDIPLYKKGKNYVNLKPTKELGYIFGTFLGDGTCKIVYRKTGSISSASISWTFNKNEQWVVDKLNDAIFKTFNRVGKVKQKKNVLIVTYYDMPFTKFIHDFGKRTNKHLPANLLVDNNEYLEGLFDGLMDSDGHNNRERLTFTNTSKRLIELFNVLSYKLYGHFPNNTEIVATSGFDDCNLDNCAQAYRTRLLGRPEFRMTNNFQVVKLLENTNDIVDHVETYDLEIDDETHSFIANNVIVHNSVCTTAMNTGFGTRNIQASVIKDISSTLNIPVIADGNIKYPGDVNKSLVLGATMVMAGSMFSNLNDSPNGIITDSQNNKFVKYWGSASSEENKTNRIEGKSILKPLNDISYLEQMRFIKEGIESGISYAGGKDISAFNHVDIIINK